MYILVKTLRSKEFKGFMDVVCHKKAYTLLEDAKQIADSYGYTIINIEKDKVEVLPIQYEMPI
jgi:hypothetical protein